VTLRNVRGAISATSDRQDDPTFAADVRGGTPIITTDAPAWLRRSDQAVTWARAMLQPRRAVVIDRLTATRMIMGNVLTRVRAAVRDRTVGS